MGGGERRQPPAAGRPRGSGSRPPSCSLAIPAGVATGLLAASSADVAAWALAGSALAAAVVLLAGSPPGGSAAPLWRLLGRRRRPLGRRPRRHRRQLRRPRRGADPERGRRAAARRAAHHRRRRRAHGGRAHVPRRQHRAHRRGDRRRRCRAWSSSAFLWPELRDADLPRGGIALGIAVGCHRRLPRRRRRAPGHHRRVAAGGRPLHDRGGARASRPAASCCRTTQFGLTDRGVRPGRGGPQRGGVLDPGRRRRAPVGVADHRAGAAAGPRPRARPARAAHPGHRGRTDLRDGPAPARTSRSTVSSSAGSRPSCSCSWRSGSSWWSARARRRLAAR